MAEGQVLIVDDNEDVRLGLGLLLEAKGYSVETAKDGCEALQKLRDGARPRLVILDLQMPRMDGHRLRSELLKDENFASLPVILCSGETDLAHLARAMDIADHMRKPVMIEKLYALLERYCPRSRD